MRHGLRSLVILSVGVVVLGMTGCAESQLALHVAKKAGQSTQPSTGERRINAEKVRRASLRPYTIRGVRYVPVDDPDYDETGLASWYGEPFHGRATATGEIFDMNRVSAAHKTLPLPSTVEVTNLENGRVLTIRVNDRGPFVKGRIIDLSRKAAQLLGLEKQGVARVRVRLDPSEEDTFVMRPAPISRTEKQLVKAAPRPVVKRVPLKTAPTTGAASPENQAARALPRPRATSAPSDRASAATFTRPVSNTQLFVQAGSFRSYENALKLKAQLSTLGPTVISHKLIGVHDWFRVRVGPLGDVAQADQTLGQVISAGSDDARIIVE